MAHTNDLMYEKMAVRYGAGLTLGDYIAALDDESATFGQFVGGTRKEWYENRLTALGVSYDASWHLADLANLLWSQADPFGAGTPEFLLLENGDNVLLENNDDVLLD
jgi:hypothetical protein